MCVCEAGNCSHDAAIGLLCVLACIELEILVGAVWKDLAGTVYKAGKKEIGVFKMGLAISDIANAKQS